MATLSLLLLVVQIILRILNFAIFARVIFSWLPQINQHNQIFTFIHDITEPIFRVVRFLPHRFGLLDLSPLYAFILVEILMYLVNSLASSLIA